MYVVHKGKYLWLLMAFLILTFNFTLYQTSIGASILPSQTHPIVLGSLIDLIIMFPIFLMLYRKKFSIRKAILFAAAGCVAAKVLIPGEILGPYETVVWLGMGVEGALMVIALSSVVAFLRNLPQFMATLKESTLPIIFSVPETMTRYVKNSSVINVLCSESLVFYYALFSWKKAPTEGLTLHKKSMFIPIMVMVIHAAIIETLAFHFILHSISMLLSIILLILNIYSVFFLIAAIQSIRLTPIHIEHNAMYISFGILKRVKVKFQDIEQVIDKKEILENKLSKDTIDFIAKDIGSNNPDVILKMKQPIKAMLFMGMQKNYSNVAIKADDPQKLKTIILNHVNVLERNE